MKIYCICEMDELSNHSASLVGFTSFQKAKEYMQKLEKENEIRMARRNHCDNCPIWEMSYAEYIKNSSFIDSYCITKSIVSKDEFDDDDDDCGCECEQAFDACKYLDTWYSINEIKVIE